MSIKKKKSQNTVFIHINWGLRSPTVGYDMGADARLECAVFHLNSMNHFPLALALAPAFRCINIMEQLLTGVIKSKKNR